MSERERSDTTKEALRRSRVRQGPRAQRHESALGRYLAAVASSHQPAAPEQARRREAMSWNVENNLVGDVMTRAVVAVGEDAPFKDIVATLGEHRVSAVPVVDAENKVLGVVSASDLLAKVVVGGQPRPPIGGGRSARVKIRRKSQAETAGELMSSPAVTTRADVSVVHAARAAALAHVRRLPVVDVEGRLLGIVTRSDLLRVFLRDDEAVRGHIEDLFAAQWCLDTSAVDIAVDDGVVTLSGQLERRTLIEPLEDAVRHTTGVVAVHNNLTYRHDDRILPPPGPPLLEREPS